MLLRFVRVLHVAALWLALSAGTIASAQPEPPRQHSALDGLTENRAKLFTLWDKTWDDPVAFFTFVLSISTIGLWIATALGIRSQSRVTRILERAYLAVEPAGVGPHYARGDRIDVSSAGHLSPRRGLPGCLSAPRPPAPSSRPTRTCCSAPVATPSPTRGTTPGVSRDGSANGRSPVLRSARRWRRIGSGTSGGTDRLAVGLKARRTGSQDCRASRFSQMPRHLRSAVGVGTCSPAD
jgi:hypothetical protein